MKPYFMRWHASKLNSAGHCKAVIEQNNCQYNYFGNHEQAQTKIVFNVSDCMTITFPKIYGSPTILEFDTYDYHTPKMCSKNVETFHC